MPQTSETPEPTGQVQDAVEGNWVDRLAPAPMRPYLRLSRADRPIGTWLLLLPCWWGILLAAAATGFRAFDIWAMVACALGAFLMRGAGCTWNDITDHEIDAKVARTRSRPIPSGQVSVQQATLWMGVQAALAFAILLSFNWMTVGLAVASLVLVVIYPFAKRFTYWPQLFLGLAINWGALVGWTAHTGSLGLPALFLYLGGIAWTIFYDTIYAHQDSDDDALIGVKSTALFFGENTKEWLRLFMMTSVILLTAAMVMALISQGNIVRLVLGVGGVWAFGWHLTWQLARLKTYDSGNCMRLFRSNRDAGLILVLILAAIVVV